MPAWQLSALRDEIRIEWDGRTVLSADRKTFDADPATVTVGTSRLANSTSEHRLHRPHHTRNAATVGHPTLWLDPPLKLEGVLAESPFVNSEPLLTIENPTGVPEAFAVSRRSPGFGDPSLRRRRECAACIAPASHPA